MVLDWSTIGAVVGVITALLSVAIAMNALNKAKESNAIARRANNISEESNRIAKSNLEVTRTSADAASEANRLHLESQERQSREMERTRTAKLNVVQGPSKSGNPYHTYSLRIRNISSVAVTDIVISQWLSHADIVSEFAREKAVTRERLEAGQEYKYELRGISDSNFRVEISYVDFRNHLIVVLGQMPSNFQYAMKMPKPSIVFAISQDGERLELLSDQDWEGERESVVQLVAQQLVGTTGSQEFLHS